MARKSKSNMNEIREVAKAYYDGAEEAEKNLAQQFFKSLDENGDMKVSLSELKKKKNVDPSFSNGEMFKQLDENGDGSLDFEEVLALYYMSQVSIPRCSSCRDLLLASYFSCLPCGGKTSFSLCCTCYSSRNFNHHHPSHDFADTRALLKLVEQLVAQTGAAPHSRRDILDQGSVAEKVENAFHAGEEAAELGIEMADAVEAINGGVDMVDVVFELGTAAVTSGCSIM